MITTDDAYKSIAEHKPPIIYLSGKSSTGKSTFGRKLKDTLGYQVVELEAVLLDVVQKHHFDEQLTFRKALFDDNNSTEKDLFLNATDRIIADSLSKRYPLVIEGAVANAETLQRILQPAPNLLFLYFHPNDLEAYIRNLTNRFMESNATSYGGLSPNFWQLVDKEAFKTFCETRELTDNLRNSIRRYAIISQKESLVRLAKFQQKFRNIIVIKIQ